MHITDHMGRDYELLPDYAKSFGPRKFYTAYASTDMQRRTEKKYDMILMIGGSICHILSDGTLVLGMNNFPQSELKKAYEFFKDSPHYSNS